MEERSAVNGRMNVRLILFPRLKIMTMKNLKTLSIRKWIKWPLKRAAINHPISYMNPDL